MLHRDNTFYVVDIFIAIDKVKRYTERFENGSNFYTMKSIGMQLFVNWKL